MANVKPGTVWRTARGTTLNTALVQMDNATNIAADGDFVVLVAGLYQYVPTAAAPNVKLGGICVFGRNPRNSIYAPGRTAATANEPNTVNIGGRGSRTSSQNPANQKFVMPILTLDEWLMTPTTDAGVVGTAYGITRVGAGNYTVAIADTTNTAVVITGYYSQDVDSGAAVRRVWVKAVNPGGPI